MPVLYRASFGYLLRHPLQLGLALLGISIGVAVMVSVDLANESSREAFYLSMDAVNGHATHQVVGGPGGIDESLYVDLRVKHGLQDIAPVLSGYVTVNGETLSLMGIDVFAERRFRSFSSPGDVSDDLLTRAAAAPGTNPEAMVRALLTTPGGLLMSTATAARLALSPSRDFELSVNGRQQRATLIGNFGAADDARLDNLVIVDIATAQRWLAMPGKLSRIDVRIAPGDDAALARIAGWLPQGTQLLSAEGRTDTTAGMSDAFMTNLTAMSLLAMLVGIFLIYNSVAFAVLQRRDLIGVLRALGVTRAEVFRLILIEAGMAGVVGAAIGVLLGTWLGQYLVALVARTVSDHFFTVAVTGVTLGWAAALKGLAIGVLATLAAAMVPAVEAAAYAPTLAMARSTLERRTGRLLPLLALAGLGLGLGAAIVLVVSGRNLVAGLGALFALILGLALCIPVAAGLLARWTSPIAGRWWGAAGRLAIGGIGRTLSRTGVAIVALAIAVSATIGVSVMVESFRASVSDWLAHTLQSDVYVGVPRGQLDTGLVADLVAVDGIAAYSTTRRSWLESQGERTRLIAIRMAPGSYAGTRIRGADSKAAWRLFDSAEAVLVSDAFAYRHDAAPGQTLTLPTDRGPAEFGIAGIYQSYDPNSGSVLMNRRTYDRYFDDRGIDSLGLFLDAEADLDAVIDRLHAVSRGRQSIAISSNARIREMSLSIFDRTFVITNVLYWLAVFVAVIGILGAMMALQLERAKEFGVLRAVGMTPRETGVLVSVQSVFMGLVAGLAAVPVGLIMAWVLIEVINRRAFGWQIDVRIEAAPIAWAMCLAVGSALFAGLYPALRAARARPALAMREE